MREIDCQRLEFVLFDADDGPGVDRARPLDHAVDGRSAGAAPLSEARSIRRGAAAASPPPVNRHLRGPSWSRGHQAVVVRRPCAGRRGSAPDRVRLLEPAERGDDSARNLPGPQVATRSSFRSDPSMRAVISAQREADTTTCTPYESPSAASAVTEASAVSSSRCRLSHPSTIRKISPNRSHNGSRFALSCR